MANELGAGSEKAVKFFIAVAVGESLLIGVIFFVFVLIFRGSVSYVFTDDSKVAREVVDLSLLLAFSILLNSVQPVLSGKYLHARAHTMRPKKGKQEKKKNPQK